MKTKRLIGNDIVDLKTSDALNFPQKTRFVKRVLCEGEQAFFFKNNQSIALFWSYWSAKEAVYRMIKKMDPTVSFSHRSYQVNFLETKRNPSVGYVTYEGLTFHVAFSTTPHWVHCIATSINNTQKIVSRISSNDEIKSDNISFCPEELQSVYSKESFLVRCLTKNMLKEVTGKDFEIQRPLLLKKFGPPEIWHNGKKCTDMDLSMSHDGSYCAGVILQSP
ncbi:MAG: 4'-phosphopantetheinyl transferase superfamily protein [Legionellales bacterium]|nr:4'-phosphopantetheinyl transferase superfamily protein [Legionellales bacterium]